MKTAWHQIKLDNAAKITEKNKQAILAKIVLVLDNIVVVLQLKLPVSLSKQLENN